MDGELKDLSFERKDPSDIPLDSEVIPLSFPALIEEWSDAICSRFRIDAALLRASLEANPI